MVSRQELEEIFNQSQSVLLGVVSLKKDQESYDRYIQWLADKNHAGMDYMENHKDILNLETQHCKLLRGVQAWKIRWDPHPTAQLVRALSNPQCP